MIEAAELARVERAELLGRMAGGFVRREAWSQAGKYVDGLLADLPRKNGWTLAEHAGDASPDRMQRLLNHAVWDEDAATAVVRDFVVEHLADEFAVAVFDESAQEKKGNLTAGVKRQYAGCVGKVTNAVNVVYCTYASPRGHALVGVRQYLPRDWADDLERRARAAIPDTVTFRTKPKIALDLLADLHAAGVAPPWATGDEVYGRDGALRGLPHEQFDLGYGCGNVSAPTSWIWAASAHTRSTSPTRISARPIPNVVDDSNVVTGALGGLTNIAPAK